jgi:hypothetical protein
LTKTGTTSTGICQNCYRLIPIFTKMEGIKESLVEDSLQKGKTISFPFLNGYTDVLCVVGESMYKDN